LGVSQFVLCSNSVKGGVIKTLMCIATLTTHARLQCNMQFWVFGSKESKAGNLFFSMCAGM
jgi:hypothetical protein